MSRILKLQNQLLSQWENKINQQRRWLLTKMIREKGIMLLTLNISIKGYVVINLSMFIQSMQLW